FHAEDGIRAFHVTGVQTCALPIFRRWRRELRATAATVQKRVSPMAIAPTKRVLPGGGTIVALIGADGTGKSTLVRETVRWLAPKIGRASGRERGESWAVVVRVMKR